MYLKARDSPHFSPRFSLRVALFAGHFVARDVTESKISKYREFAGQATSIPTLGRLTVNVARAKIRSVHSRSTLVQVRSGHAAESI
jgi:hypothetical protein